MGDNRDTYLGHKVTNFTEQKLKRHYNWSYPQINSDDDFVSCGMSCSVCATVCLPAVCQCGVLCFVDFTDDDDLTPPKNLPQSRLWTDDEVRKLRKVAKQLRRNEHVDWNSVADEFGRTRMALMNKIAKV